MHSSSRIFWQKTVVAILSILLLFSAGKLLMHKFIRTQAEEVFATYPSDGSFVADRDAFFTFLTDVIGDAYSYLQYKEETLGFAWEEVIGFYQPKIAEIHDQQFVEDYLYLCNEMVSLLGDGHTSIQPMSFLANDRSIAFDISKRHDQYILAAFPQSFAQQVTWLEPGLVIQTIDGMDVAMLIDSLLEISGYGLLASGEELLLPNLFSTYYFYLLRDAQPDAVRLGIQVDSELRELTARWQPRLAVRDIHGVRVSGPQPKVGVEASLLYNGQIGYLKIDTLNSELITNRAIDDAFGQIANTQGIILDIRDNGGGSFSSHGVRILEHFLEESTIVGYKEFRNSNLLHVFGLNSLHYPGRMPVEKAFSDPIQLSANKSQRSFANKPLVILVNERIFSSTDILLSAFVDLGIGIVVGRTNKGNSGQPLRIETPWNQWGIAFSSIISRSPSFVVIEDRIIEPDVFVPLSRQELLGEDRIFQSGLTHLIEMLGITENEN